MINLSPDFKRWLFSLLCCWEPTALTVGDLTVTDDLTVGDDATITGDVAVTGGLAVTGTIAATALITAATVTAGDVNVTDDLVVTDDFTLNGAFTRSTVSQPIIRQGEVTLIAGTLPVAGTWVTADTVIQLTYIGGAVVTDAAAYTRTAGVGFDIFGVGTNVVGWTAFTPQA